MGARIRGSLGGLARRSGALPLGASARGKREVDGGVPAVLRGREQRSRLPLQRRGSFDPELTRPLYKVWALEKAGLHPTGHDDRGEIRTDGASALSLPLFAATSIEEEVEW